MVKCLNKIKNFVIKFFDEDDSIGLRSIEKIKIPKDVSAQKKEKEFSFYDIMK